MAVGKHRSSGGRDRTLNLRRGQSPPMLCIFQRATDQSSRDVVAIAAMIPRHHLRQSSALVRSIVTKNTATLPRGAPLGLGRLDLPRSPTSLACRRTAPGGHHAAKLGQECIGRLHGFPFHEPDIALSLTTTQRYLTCWRVRRFGERRRACGEIL
jgi:hypothetical protein